MKSLKIRFEGTKGVSLDPEVEVSGKLNEMQSALVNVVCRKGYSGNLSELQGTHLVALIKNGAVLDAQGARNTAAAAAIETAFLFNQTEAELGVRSRPERIKKFTLDPLAIESRRVVLGGSFEFLDGSSSRFKNIL